MSADSKSTTENLFKKRLTVNLETRDSPLVSVIIIFLDEKEFLGEAIETVLAQTYAPWELLLIDDGSTDESNEIARRYAEQYPGKVRYLEHEDHQNRGMSASRNLGIRHAKGDYVAFLDADDVWLPDKLEQQVAILRSQPEAAMVCGPVQWWYSWTGKSEDAERDSVVALNVEPDALIRPPELLARLLASETPTTTGSLLRREVIDSVGGFEESFPGLYEDQVFFAKICSQAPVFVVSRCWYKWRKHPESSCSIAVREGQYRAARLRFLTWLESYVASQRINDPRIWQALRREMRRSRHPVRTRVLSEARHYVQQAAEVSKAVGRRTLPLAVYRRVKSVCDSFRGAGS